MEKIIILDAGSQVTQLIGRRLRELNVFCEIYPYNKMPEIDATVKGVIISGSPCSVRDANAPHKAFIIIIISPRSETEGMLFASVGSL